MEHSSFQSVQTFFKQIDGETHEITEAVHMKNGKGHKLVRTRNNQTVRVSKRPLRPRELHNIYNRIFMPHLFKETKTRKRKAKGKQAKHQK